MNWMSINVEPLANVEPAGSPSLWRALGDDPQFALRPVPAEGGWFQLELEMAGVGDSLSHPCVYPDYGAGASEAERIALPAPADDGWIRVVIRLKYAPVALRLDPSTAALTLRVGVCRLAKLRRDQAFLRMLRAIGTAAGNDAARLVLASARGLLSGESRRVGELIYAAYLDKVLVGPSTYDQWIARFDVPMAAEEARGRLAALPSKPVFSVVMPTYNTPDALLRQAIESVRRQSYPDWELCIADDASKARHVRATLERYAALDPRIKVVFRERNGHISESSNSALAVATGSHIVLLDHDDELHPDALLWMAEAIAAHSEAALLYSDEDKIDLAGRRFDPYFKPAFDPDLILGQNFICHLGVYRRDVVERVGGFRKGYEGSQDWDLALRVIDAAGDAAIVHVPRVLYHWRAIEGSTARGIGEKNYAATAGERAVRDALARRSVDAAVDGTAAGHVRVRLKAPARPPKVSIIVPTRDKVDLLKVCIDSVLACTDYPDFELVVIDNGSVEPETLDYFEALRSVERVRVLPYPHPFNYSAINNFGVRETAGELVCLMNNDIEAIDAGWLEAMVVHALRPGIGAVGAMLYYPNDTIQHAGVLVGAGGVGGHAFGGERRGAGGYMGRLHLTHSALAVTAACLVVRRTVWDEVGGLDEGLKVAFNDVDFCLRVAKAGYRNLWTPAAELYHHESASRGHEDTPEKQARFKSEVDFMLRRWGAALEADPAYNPNLSLNAAPFSLAFPPRAATPRLGRFVAG